MGYSNIKENCLLNLLITIFICILLSSCKIGNVKRSIAVNEKMDSLILIYDTTINKKTQFVRANPDSVQLFFWGEYNDTVLIIINGIIKAKMPLKNTNDNSYDNEADYSNECYGLICKKPKTLVIIRLLRTGNYVKFYLDKRYPLCSITRNNGTWRIAQRKDYEYIETYRVIK